MAEIINKDPNEKSFTRRDSATAILRKMGVAKENYRELMEILTDQHGSIYIINLGHVRAFLSSKAKPASAPKIITRSESVAKRDAKKSVAAPAEKSSGGLPNRSMGVDTKKSNGGAKTNGAKRTVSSAIRELVKAGKTNAEIWAVVQPEFKLADNKKHYPGWYRSEMNRKDA